MRSFILCVLMAFTFEASVLPFHAAEHSFQKFQLNKQSVVTPADACELCSTWLNSAHVDFTTSQVAQSLTAVDDIVTFASELDLLNSLALPQARAPPQAT